MFARKHRLTRKKDIELVLKRGQRRRGQFCVATVWFVSGDIAIKKGFTKADLKTAVIVGKKVSKSAVTRNKLKRQYREMLKSAVRDNIIRPGILVVCLVQPSALNMPYEQQKQDLYALFTPRKK